jgi:hypothetical protein
MKVAIASDIHLEFGDLDLDNTENAKVLILGGDILVAKDVVNRDSHDVMGPEYRSLRFHEFMQRCCARFSNVIYILGNHEHYHGDFADSVFHLKDKFKYLKNLYLLDNDIIKIDDVTFIGGTLWTDMNKEDSVTMSNIATRMNDFRIVSNSNSPYKKNQRFPAFTPADAVDEFKKMISLIDNAIKTNSTDKYIVVGHHAPSKQSTHPRYKDEFYMNGGYSSDLTDFIIDRPQIKLWTHGHTHDGFDYMIGSTRVVCNPRGYIGYEDMADDFQLKYIEV